MREVECGESVCWLKSLKDLRLVILGFLKLYQKWVKMTATFGMI